MPPPPPEEHAASFLLLSFLDDRAWRPAIFFESARLPSGWRQGCSSVGRLKRSAGLREQITTRYGALRSTMTNPWPGTSGSTLP
jgi:hypothetical protein